MEKETIIGTFQSSKSFGFVIPDNKKENKKDIFISKKYFNKARSNDKVVVEIIKKEENGRKPEGKVIEVIGNINVAGIDMLSIIKQFKLQNEFPVPVLNEANKIKNEIDIKELENRKDFRKDIVFTIDGEDAKDLDDAVSVEKIGENYILKVHIADVSHYVKENSFIDKEAVIRGTSVYMLDRVIPMLPEKLSNGICSLNAGKDRLTLSVIMEIDKNGDVISSEVCKGVINVTKRMSYTIVQKLLDLSEQDKIDYKLEEYIEYTKYFKLMEELANILIDRRNKQGYLDLDIPESKITLDKNGRAINVDKYKLYFSNQIIEQFMLKANETIAEKFYWLEAPFIYRVHEVPDQDKITDLNRFLSNFGYRIKGNKENIHPKAFSTILEDIKGKKEEKVISNLILRTLKVARYEAENKGHFGIASKYYCHFTSPIRRYPDLYIHRIISKYLECNYLIKDDYKERQNELAVKLSQTTSDCEKVAQKAEREAENLKKAEYMETKIGEIYDGIISGVTNFGVFVELENTIEGLIRFDNLGNEYFEYDDEHKQLIGEVTRIVFKMGDSIKIQVIEASKTTRKVAFARVIK